MRRLLMLIFLIGFTSRLAAHDADLARSGLDFSGSPLSEEQVADMTKSLKQRLSDATDQIKKNPKSLDDYSKRGDVNFFLGQFADAIADYDRMIELDETVLASHWRRGIALFYAERYKEAADQFEKYHSFDQVDRENGIWRYLSQHRAYGQEKAREGLLKYQKDDREPFPVIYQLFGGSVTPDEILRQINEARISKVEREKRLFYASLYIGLNHAVAGETPAARQHLDAATRNTWGPTAGYGPNYMWHVGRLHEQILRKNDK